MRTRRVYGIAAAAVAALCLTCLPATQTVAVSPAGHGGGTDGGTGAGPAPQASVWVTTADGAERMQQQAPVAFRPGGSDLTTLTVDPGRTYQSVDGFGGALTDSSAAVLSQLPTAARDSAMRQLFDPRQGIGISFLRQPIGSSDRRQLVERRGPAPLPLTCPAPRGAPKPPWARPSPLRTHGSNSP